MSEALIEMQNVEKVFLTDEVETHALSNIHLAVGKNEWLSIVGPSGSGKTTLLAILGLLDTATGGQQQRVAVARAVAGDPLILLADEPTGNLDSKNGQAVMKLLSELHQGGSTLIMVTHDPAYARLATRTVSLFDGRIVEETGSSAA